MLAWETFWILRFYSGSALIPRHSFLCAFNDHSSRIFEKTRITFLRSKKTYNSFRVSSEILKYQDYSYFYRVDLCFKSSLKISYIAVENNLPKNLPWNFHTNMRGEFLHEDGVFYLESAIKRWNTQVLFPSFDLIKCSKGNKHFCLTANAADQFPKVWKICIANIEMLRM